jgi:hypothetical protein
MRLRQSGIAATKIPYYAAMQHPREHAVVKTPRKFYEPLAIGAPAPYREPPVRVERMIHFVPPHNEKVRAKIGEPLHEVDVALGHPGYKVTADAGAEPRVGVQQDLRHYRVARMVDACAAAGIKPFYGPFGDFSDPQACETQFRNAYLMGRAGAWSLHPSQIAIGKRVFSPDPAEVGFAEKILAVMPDGSGAVMIDGKMQDDATWKQVAAKDPDLAPAYGL